ncbi:MAG: FtsX-like permease family protein [Bryobacteraceae bacterium]
MTGKIVLENLKHRPIPSLLSTLLIGVSVMLILTLVGLSFGLSEDAQRRQAGTGADLIILGSTGASVLSGHSATIPEQLVPKLEQQPHIKAALGVMTHSIELPLVASGVDLKQLQRFNGGFSYVAGGEFQGPHDVLIDIRIAKQRHLGVGDTTKFSNVPGVWRVAGIIGEGKLARVALPLHVVQEMDSAEGKVTQIYVRLDDPANSDQVIKNLQAQLPSYSIATMSDYMALFGVSKIPGVTPFLAVMVGVGMFTGAICVCLSMYMAVLQRTREIGILKSLGASKGFILGVIETEAALLGLGGTIVGILLSIVAWWLINTFIPASLPVILKPAWWPIAAVIAIASALLGALYPGLNAAAHDPIEALSYE